MRAYYPRKDGSLLCQESRVSVQRAVKNGRRAVTKKRDVVSEGGVMVRRIGFISELPKKKSQEIKCFPQRSTDFLGIDFDLVVIKLQSMLPDPIPLTKAGLERMKKLQAQKGRAGGLPVNQPRSWSQLGSFEAHPALMLVITAPIGEVSQDAVWDAVDSEESRKFLELRNSKEWKETEQHLLKLEDGKHSIGQRRK
ncbi:hypothetical protein Droror1_Dr00028065 [Drosera rotundifolia]